MPDFDVDFCQNRRDEVIDYVREKYGKDNVGQIITFGSLKARSVIRDVVRVMGLPFAEGDRIAKLVPDPVQGKTPPLKELVFGSDKMPAEPRLEELYKKPAVISQWVDEKGVQQTVTTKDLLDIAMSLEGLNRQAGLHAAGVVIADKPLWEYVPAYKDDKSEMLVSQFAKDEVEAAGLVKFDFLGLKTLTVIDDALRMVKQNHPEMKDFTAADIPIDDPDVYELISRGDTAGVFQMESSGFTEMVMKMKPSRFEDVIAAGALYRPGPLDQKLEDGRTMVDVYIDRKHGREKVAVPAPAARAGARADLRRHRLPGAGDADRPGPGRLLARRRRPAPPRDGQEEGRGDGEAARHLHRRARRRRASTRRSPTDVFDLMEKFAAYGFNKSHSAAYGLLTVQTAWLKAHYPVEFMAALISSEASNTDKVVLHISEARASGIEVLPPDVNESGRRVRRVPAPARARRRASKGRIRFGLGAVRGVGESAVQAILEARAARAGRSRASTTSPRASTRRRSTRRWSRRW